MDDEDPYKHRHTLEQVKAAMEESLEYARKNKLFTCETEDILGFHLRVAREEYERLSPEERSLSYDDLELLEIPPTTITEEWVVPEHIAKIIEKVSRRPTDAELVDLQDSLWIKPNLKHLYLELPLLRTSPEGDLAEFQHMISSLRIGDEWHVRNHGLPLDSDDGLSFTEEEEEFARNLDASIESEKMEVSEETVRIIENLAKGMEWTDEKWERMIDELMAFTPRTSGCYISPPLPPVPSPMEDFLPDGGVCLVSDVSELSSGVSEALAEAEKVLNEKTGNVWPTDVPLDCIFGKEPPQQGNEAWPVKISERLLEEEQPLELRPEPGILAPENPSPAVMEADPDKSSSAQSSGDESLSEEDVDAGSEDSLLGTQYEDITTETLFDLGHNAATIAQIKLPVPPINMDFGPLPWEEGQNNVEEIFRWMRENNEEESDSLFWSDDEEEHYEQKLNTLEKRIFGLDRDDLFPEGTSLLEDPNPFPSSRLPLDNMSHFDDDYEQHRLFNIEQLLDEMPEWPSAGTPHVRDYSWDKLINRQKRRRLEDAASQSVVSQENGKQTLIKAPELLFGLHAFAKPGKEQACEAKAKESEVQTGQAEAPISTTADASPCPPMNTLVRPPKVVLSMTIPRAIRTHILQALPNLEFVERDYQENKRDGKNINEAEISFRSGGIVITTMVTLRQSGSGQNMSVFQQRIETLSAKYERLNVLVYRSQESELCGDSLPELSPSDALAFARLQGFAHSLPGDVSVMYICGGERFVGLWTASLLCREQANEEMGHERFLTEAETPQETFLCQAGLNVYDAQIVLGLSCEESNMPCQSGIARFVTMSPDERNTCFGPHMGCQRALERVNGRIET